MAKSFALSLSLGVGTETSLPGEFASSTRSDRVASVCRSIKVNVTLLGNQQVVEATSDVSNVPFAHLPTPLHSLAKIVPSSIGQCQSDRHGLPLLLGM